MYVKHNFSTQRITPKVNVDKDFFFVWVSRSYILVRRLFGLGAGASSKRYFKQFLEHFEVVSEMFLRTYGDRVSFSF